MRRLPSGNWGDEIARRALSAHGRSPRWNLSWETENQREARRRKTQILKLIDDGHLDIIEEIRAGRYTVTDVCRRLQEGSAATSLKPRAPSASLRTLCDTFLSSKRTKSTGTQQIAERFTNHLLNTFEPETIVSTIETSQVQHLFATWAPSTQKLARATFGAIWRHGQLPDIWKDFSIARPHKKKDRVVTPKEWNQLYFASRDTPTHAIFCLAFMAGLRRGEITHLRPQDYDGTRGTVTVTEKPHWDPKTKNSVRTILLPMTAKKALDAHLMNWSSKWWIFPAPRDPGQPLPPETLRAQLASLFKNANVPFGRGAITLHTGRHTAISNALSRGISVAAAARYFGDTPKTLLSTYAHIIEGDEERIAKALENDDYTLKDTQDTIYPHDGTS